jgi:hypothetical protein
VSNPPPFSSIAQDTTKEAEPQYYMDLLVIPDSATQKAKDIFNMPEIRPMNLRAGKKLVNLNNPKIAANLEAAYGQTRGHLAPTPCANCTKQNPKGPWKECVQVEGYFDRACCNCRYNNGGRSCTLHRLNAAPNDPAPLRSASAKPQPSKPREPSKWSRKANRLMGKGKGKEVAKEAEDDIEEEVEDENEGDMNTLSRGGVFRPGGTFTREDFPQTDKQLQHHEEDLTHPRQIAKDRAGPRWLRGG